MARRGRAARIGLDLLAIALSATLLTLSLPPYDLHGLAWIALVPMLLATLEASAAGALWIPFATCYVFDFAHAGWMLEIEGIHPLNMALPVVVHAAYFGAFGGVARALHRRLPRADVLTLPAAWVAIEFLRFHLGFLSFPWGVLAYSQYAVPPVAGVAAITGLHGVSFLVAAGNTLAAAGVRALWRRRGAGAPARLRPPVAAVSVTGFAIALVAGAAFGRAPESALTLRVAWVQPGDRPAAEPGSASPDPLFLRHRELTRRVARAAPDLVVWPESSVRGRLPYDRTLARDLAELAREVHSYLLIGSSAQEKQRDGARGAQAANSAFLLTPDGVWAGRYDKVRLLPFNEYLPLRGLFDWPAWIVGAVTDARAGRDYTVFEADRARFAVMICWENLFSGGFRRAAAQGVDFMVSMTNESFIESPAARRQMLAMNVFRAVENRVAIVRAATTGVSALIEPDGRIADRVRDDRGNDVDVPGVLVADVPLLPERSFYNRSGDWFVGVCAGIVLAAALRARVG